MDLKENYTNIYINIEQLKTHKNEFHFIDMKINKNSDLVIK